jgi:hypothetical protein
MFDTLGKAYRRNGTSIVDLIMTFMPRAGIADIRNRSSLCTLCKIEAPRVSTKQTLPPQKDLPLLATGQRVLGQILEE